MVEVGLSRTNVYKLVSLESRYKNIKSLPVWIIFAQEDTET